MPFKTVTTTQRKGIFDKTANTVSYIKSDLPIFVPKDGDNAVRILPTLEEDQYAQLLGIELRVYFIKNKFWVSPTAFNGQKYDPLSYKYFQMRNSEIKAAEKYRGQRRFVMHILDANDRKNPQLKIWPGPISLVEELVDLSRNPKTGDVIPIEDPNQGRLIYFNKSGTGAATRYSQLVIDDKSYPIDLKLADQIQPFKKIIRASSESALEKLVNSPEGDSDE